MQRLATMMVAAAFVLFAALPAAAQEEPVDVTIRQINELSPENLNTLKQRGAELTNDEVEQLIRSQYTGQEVRFTAVVLSDPRKSGLATPNAQTGLPGRLHIFVRDVAAETEGPLGMNTQIVDGTYQQSGSANLFIGDIIEVVGTVTYFGNTQQIGVTSITLIGDIESEGLSASILDPVSTTTDEIMVPLGPLSTQPDWDRFSDFINQYVRIEGATVWRSPNRTDARPNYIVTSDAAQTFIHSDDISLRYRNDMSGYAPEYDRRASDDLFEAPPAGATINIQGFTLLRGTFAAEPVGTPSASLFRIAPWTDEDLVVTAEPLITDIAPEPLERVVGEESVEVEIGFEGDVADVVEATLYYSTSVHAAKSGAASQDEIAVPMEVEDGKLVAEIPAQPDGAFVSYRAVIVDRTGTEYATPTTSTYRVLYNGVTEVRHIRETQTGLRIASPFAGQTVDMDIVARVQTDPTESGLISIQDDEGLAPWSGVWVRPTEALSAALNQGDEIRITRGTITYDFQVTHLTIEEYEILDTTTDPYPHKVVTTDILQDPAIAEPHVGMLLRFEDVVITNPDAGFGEWTFSTNADGSDFVYADDLSEPFSSTFASTTFQENDSVTYLQGTWYYSFGFYKLIPLTFGDVGEITSTSTESELALEFSLGQNYPNPFNPTTSIEFRVPAAGHATLEVFDMLGRRVATLVNGLVPAGTHQVRFEAGGLASGLYVYRLSSGERVTSRTMMLVK
jgi:hypothetical protein